MSFSLFSQGFLSNLHDLMAGVSTAVPNSFGLMFLMALEVLLINICLVLLFALIGAAFLKRMKITSGELEQEKRKAHQEAEQLIEHARAESLQIIEEGNKKAGELLQRVQAVTEGVEQQLSRGFHEFAQQESKRLHDTVESFIEIHRGVVDQSKTEHLNAMTAITKEMAGEAQKSFAAFEAFLKEQTARYEEALQRQVQEGFMSVQKEISDYKHRSLRKVEEAIYRILNLVAKTVLGKTLSFEDQQDLVIHALDEAKQQGFFEP